MEYINWLKPSIQLAIQKLGNWFQMLLTDSALVNPRQITKVAEKY